MKKSILLTGAAGNLGHIVMKHLLEAGYHLLVTTRSPAEVETLQSDTVGAHALDLTDEAAVQAYVQRISAESNIEGAVLLAGGFVAGGLLQTDGATLQKMFALNFETAFYLVRELLPVFEKRGGGQFILIGARPALDPEAGKDLAAYAFSKNLVFQLAEFVNAYGKDKGINATVIVPSIIDTLANRQAMPQANPAKWVSPDAIAETIRFVFSDAGKQMKESVLKLYNEA